MEEGTGKWRKIWDKFRYSGTLSRLLSLFTESLHSLSVHMFDFHWQAFQFDECKKQLQDGNCLFIIDFAQNCTHCRQDELEVILVTQTDDTTPFCNLLSLPRML